VTQRPIIGVATQTLEPVPGQLPLAWVMGQKYIHVLRRAGAIPWIIPLLEGDEATLRGIYDRLDGVFLTGGVDVDPSSYQAAKAPHCGRTDPPRDWTELRLVRWAWDDGKPVLGVCRGMQLINVALGGALFQDLAREFKADLKHDNFPAPENAYRRDELIHQVTVEPGSRLAGILGGGEFLVNSMHHQGVRRLGPELRACARAADGAIEGLEGTNGRFLLGVQWHPEELTETQPAMRRLFEAFIEAAAAFRPTALPSDGRLAPATDRP
jgi:putative glutamine amidotransferase